MKSQSTSVNLKKITGKVLMLAVLLLSAGFVQAQTPAYSVGSLTAGSNVIPFGNGTTWNSYRCQFLYLPGQFGTVPSGMAISKIYFVPTSSGTATLTDFNVSIGQANITGLSTAGWVPGLTLALSESSYTFTRTTSQWWEITLQTPIPYDPSQPLIIDVWKTSSTASIGLRNQTASPGNRRAYAPFPSATPSGASTTMYTFGFDLVPLAPDNAGITALISPVNFCTGNHPVQVELTNSGLNTLTSATIDWELDNIPQPAINWTGSLATGAKTTVTLGTNIPFGATIRTIKAWSSLPNGKADTVNADDTLNNAVRAGLSGVYVVGTNGDFPTVVAAADALNQFGVCGPVTMNILDGTYTGQVQLNNINGASAANRITFQSQNGNPANVTIAAVPTTTGHVFSYNNASYITLRNLTVQSNSGTNDGRVLVFSGAASYDSVVNCTINCSPGATGTNTTGIYATDLTGSDNAFINNRVNRGYYGVYWRGTSTSNKTANAVFEGNTITDAYVYSNYFYYTDNLKFRNNTVRAINSPTTHYGIYGYYNDGALEVINNDIIITGNGQKSGIYMLYSDASSAVRGITLNNAIAIDCGSSTAYGLYSSYGSYNDFVNNSVSINTTSTDALAARFYYNTTSTGNHNIYNNAFSNVTGDGYTMYVYSANSTYNNYWDFNNIHTGNGKAVEVGTPATTYATLTAWSNASGYDKHSINYDPGFMGITDVRPDVNNPASWSLNGRGLHITANNKDHNGNARVTLRPDGVPDIGAFEFNPETVPPLAKATPDSVSPGDMQVYTFGEQKVAAIKWGMAGLTAPLEVRQYSGVKAPGVATAASPYGSMYFYTDVKPTAGGNTFDFEMELDYMDIWLGDIPNDNNLKLAHRVTGYPWMVYSGGLSTVNTGTKELDATAMNRYGIFTGLEDGSIKSAFVRAQGKTIICVGNTVQLNAEPQDGDYYKWYFNSTPIPGAEGASVKSITASQAGDYSVAITFSGKTIESVPLSITTIAAPNALISANGPLTYCIGNGLVLDAGMGQGVTYQWQLDGNNIPGATSNTYPVNQTGNYTVIVENIGCATTSTVTPVTAGPIAVNLGNDTSYCEVPNVWATLDAGYPGAKYLWSTGDTSRVIEVKNSGTYWVNVDAGPNCQGTDQVQVNIDPLPAANGISFVQNGNTYQFYASGTVNVTGYMWLFSDGSTSIDATPTKTINGQLYVRLVLFNQCGTDTVQLGWPLSVTNTVEENTITVFPNPASDYINIRTGNTAVKQLMIINSVGTVVSTIDQVSGKSEYRINVANLPAGNYMLRAATENGVTNKQFSVIR
jgi:hypothetical protein